MNIELDARLRVFAALIRRRSFSKAAEDLLISQPAVSRHLANLEKSLGVQLIYRNNQETWLTPTGEYLAPFVLQAEALLV